MSELPDFAVMSKEAVVDWFLTHDTRVLIEQAAHGVEPMVQVDERGEPVMRPATFRLPPSMIEWLEAAAGRDREGKSGIVRRALQEYRDRHGDLAA